MTEETQPNATPKSTKATTRSEELRVVVRPFPKIVFFYLTWIASAICALAPGGGSGVDAAEPSSVVCLAWMGVFFFNLLVISFDFNEERSLVGVLLVIATALALLYFGVLGAVSEWFTNLKPMMNDTFFWSIFVGFSAIYLLVWLYSRINYWEFRPNEIIHRYGVFPKMKRYGTDDLRWDKEIPDMMERLLLGSGRIILQTPHEKHPVVVEHVIKIGSIDERIADILGVKAVVTKEVRDAG